MKVLILNWKDPRAPDAGGAEVYVERVAQLWVASGHEVTVLVPDYGEPSEPKSRDGITYIRRGTPRRIHAAGRAFVRRHGRTFDAILESVSTRPFFCTEAAGGRATVLYYQLAKEVWHQEFPRPVATLGRYVVEPWWLRRLRGAHVVTISPSTAADLETRKVAVAAVVPPGCDANHGGTRRTPPRIEQPRLVVLGRLVRTKRPFDALQAFTILRRRFPRAELHCIGDGYLRASIERARVPGVVVHGYVSEARKREILSTADLALVPGTREGWGIVAIEAAAAGLPVVAYDIPGLRDAVVHGSTGLLTARTADALAASAERILKDPALWQRCSLAARARATSYTWERTAAALMAVLEGRRTDYQLGAPSRPKATVSA